MSDMSVDMPIEEYQYGNYNKDFFDDKSKLKLYVNDSRPSLKLYLNSEEIYNNIYQNINNFDKAVEILFKESLGLVYKSYDKILNIINNNREKFKSILNISNECDNFTNTDIFNYIIEKYTYTEKPINDILGLFYPDLELETKEKIQDKFNTNINWVNSGSESNFIKFNVNDINNIRVDNNTNNNSIIFKVSPHLKKIVNSIGSPNTLNPQLISYKFSVDFDLGAISNTLLWSAIYDNPEGTIVDIDSFVEVNLVKFQPKIYDLSRRIILEIYDRIQDVNGNFDKFNAKVSNLCYNFLKSDYNQNVINKTKYLLRSSLGSDAAIGRNSNFYKLFNNIDDRNKIIDLLFTLEKRDDFDEYNNNTQYISDLINELSGNDSSSSLKAKKLALILYKYAFSSFFSNTVLVQYNDLHGKKEDILKKDKVFYSREFDKKYNLIDLFVNTEKISDYNLKDYYQELIRSIKKTSEFITTPSYKLYNGEKESFLYSKALRFINVYTVALMLYLSTILEYVDILTENKSLYNEKYDKKLEYSLRKTIFHSAECIKYILLHILSFSPEIMVCKEFYFDKNTINGQGLSKLNFMLNIVENNFNYNDDLATCKKSSLLENIFNLLADKESPKLIETLKNDLYTPLEEALGRFINESFTYRLI